MIERERTLCENYMLLINSAMDKISSAYEALTIEHRRVQEEIEAFEKFYKLVEDVSPDQNYKNELDKICIVEDTTQNGIEKIRIMYEGTVMSVSHYDDEYDDTYSSSIIEEFGHDIAVALIKSREFDQVHKSTLLNGIKSSIHERRELKTAVESEQESIKSARDRIKDIANTLENIRKRRSYVSGDQNVDDHTNKIEDLYTQCDRTASIRFEDIQQIGESMQLDADDEDLYSYLYQDASFKYPILATIGEIGMKIERAQHDLDAMLQSDGDSQADC